MSSAMATRAAGTSPVAKLAYAFSTISLLVAIRCPLSYPPKCPLATVMHSFESRCRQGGATSARLLRSPELPVLCTRTGRPPRCPCADPGHTGGATVERFPESARVRVECCLLYTSDAAAEEASV